MATTRIYYVGTKDEERAYADRTGRSWKPGDSDDIEDSLAQVLLQHPDVFSAEKPKEQPRAAAPVDIAANTSTQLSDHLIDVMEGFLLADVGLDAWNNLTERERAAWIAKALATDGDDAPAGDTATDALTAEHLETLDLDALKALAAERGVTHHPNAGKAKVIAAILKAQG